MHDPRTRATTSISVPSAADTDGPEGSSAYTHAHWRWAPVRGVGCSESPQAEGASRTSRVPGRFSRAPSSGVLPRHFVQVDATPSSWVLLQHLGPLPLPRRSLRCLSSRFSVADLKPRYDPRDSGGSHGGSVSGTLKKASCLVGLSFHGDGEVIGGD